MCLTKKIEAPPHMPNSSRMTCSDDTLIYHAKMPMLEYCKHTLVRRIRWFPQAMQAALQRPALARPRPLRKRGLQTRSMSTSKPSHVAQPFGPPTKTSQTQQAPHTRQETENLFSSSSKTGANLSALQHPKLSPSHTLRSIQWEGLFAKRGFVRKRADRGAKASAILSSG